MTEDNLAQRRICLLCKETFTVGEMYPGKRYIDPLQCPYCRNDKTDAIPGAERGEVLTDE